MADETTTVPTAPKTPVKVSTPAKAKAAAPVKPVKQFAGFGQKNRPEKHVDTTAGLGGSFKFVNGARVPA